MAKYCLRLKNLLTDKTELESENRQLEVLKKKIVLT